MCVKILTKRNAVHAFDPFYEAIPLKQEEGVPSSGGQGWTRVGKGGQGWAKATGKSRKDWNWNICAATAFARTWPPKTSFSSIFLLNI